MRRGLDTNVLVYAHVPAFEEHARVRAFVLEQLRDPKVSLVITPGVLHELVHVVTDPKRFAEPVALADALAVSRLYLGKLNVEVLGIDELVMLDAFDLMERYQLGRKRIADTLFAATLLHHGVYELITCNGRDFQIFEELRIIDPRA